MQARELVQELLQLDQTPKAWAVKQPEYDSLCTLTTVCNHLLWLCCNQLGICSDQLWHCSNQLRFMQARELVQELLQLDPTNARGLGPLGSLNMTPHAR